MKQKYHLASALTLIAVVVSLTLPAHAAAQRGSFRSDFLKTSTEFKKAFRPVIADAGKSTVEIRDDKKRVALGTIVDTNGLILTKASEMGDNPLVRLNGKDIKAKVLAKHEGHDLALLEIKADDLTPANFRPSKEAPVGNWAVSVGTGADPAALGVVSVALRKMPTTNFPFKFFNQRAYLGILLDSKAENARVEQVMPRTGAFKGGMRAGDVILSIAGTMTKTSDAVRKALTPYKDGDMVTVRIRRKEEEKDLKIRLGKRPASRGDIQNKMGSKLSKRTTGFPVILQHDSVLPPDMCGGPLVDLDGRVIGINIARAGRTESYAVPTEAILPLLKEMRAGKHKVTEKKENSK